MRKLPSLNALRAFEATGRLGRMTLAADELAVTHSAVSRQIKHLEEVLGVELLDGPKNRLRLTSPEHGAQQEWSRTFFSSPGVASTGRSISVMVAGPSLMGCCERWVSGTGACGGGRCWSGRVDLRQVTTNLAGAASLRLCSDRQRERRASAKSLSAPGQTDAFRSAQQMSRASNRSRGARDRRRLFSAWKGSCRPRRALHM